MASESSTPATIATPAPAPTAAQEQHEKKTKKAFMGLRIPRKPRAVVKNDESATTLLDSVAKRDPGARVTKRSAAASGGKRKSYDGYDTVSLGNGTASTVVKYVAAAAAIAGLAYVGSQKGLSPLNGMTPRGVPAPQPSASPSPPSGPSSATNGTSLSGGGPTVSLSTSHFSG